MLFDISLFFWYNNYMEKIVKKILKYDIPCSNAKRDELVANIVAMALHMLDKTGKYNFPDNCVDIVYKNIKGCAGQTNENLQVSYRKNVLKDAEYFFDDIMIIAHEICHVVQNYKKDNNVKNVDLYYSSDDKFDPLLTKIILICFPKYIKSLNKKGLDNLLESCDEIKQINDYFESFYYLQEVELEAYDFQVRFMKKIFEIAENLNLNNIEKEKLKIYKIKSQQDIEFMENLIIRSKKLRTSQLVTNKVKHYCDCIMQDIFERNPNLFEDLAAHNDEDLDHIYHDVYNMVCVLELNYNDDIAHKLYNALMKSKMLYDDKTELMNELYGFTSIKLNEEQTEFLKKIMLKYNEKANCKLKYEILSKDKTRIAYEKEIFSPVM